MRFELLAEDTGTSARLGRLHTEHGAVDTPVFMTVGTLGNVKGVHTQQLMDVVDAPMLLGNTLHLYLRPGTEVLEHAGGLHGFLKWPRPILSDSGGFQVYSLSAIRSIKEEGVKFKSHIDGSSHFFSPEFSVDVQRSIGADIVMAFDECTPYPCTHEYAAKSMHMTHRWLDRCLLRMERTKALYGHHQELFGIVQGSVYPDLRRQSAEYVAYSNCFGNAIGGLSVGEPSEEMYAMSALVCQILPRHKPRYLMGVGKPEDLLENIARGIDMFDCVMPTRNGRNGTIFTAEGRMNMRNAKWKSDFKPLNDQRLSFLDDWYSRAYLRHLFNSGEMLGGIIASVQNLVFYQWLMAEARMHLAQGSFGPWMRDILPKLKRKL
ncbi:MAG: tRNA guanosine(34) transglycosylase Tgt [Bacteroidetes bacterium]|jgi:queuine tRNA-ribosyltransferase|nr:tRNA guanosine(34) transglycosylase Tgt [Bacteroidota bacterium]